MRGLASRERAPLQVGGSGASYAGSCFALRHTVEPLLERTDPPRLVVYVPLARERTHSALIELEVAGVVMQPGQPPPACNTRLALIARHALRPLLGEEALAAIEKQVAAGHLGVADLGTIAEMGCGSASGVLTHIFGTANAQTVALAFLTEKSHDAAVVERSSHLELVALTCGTR